MSRAALLSQLGQAHITAARENRSDIKPLGRILREMRAMRTLYGTFPAHYLRLGLYHRSVANPLHFLPHAEGARRRAAMQPIEVQRVLRDKRRLNARLAEVGVATAETLFTVDAGRITRDEAEITADDAARIIADAPYQVMSKLADGDGGKGITVVEDPAGSVAAAVASGRPHIFEERLMSHPEMAPMSNGAINGIRIDTTHTPDGWAHSAAALRLAGAGEIVDNGSAGGKLVPLDLATGRARTGWFDYKTGCIPRGDRHPVTGHPIDGFQLPQWEELKALTVRAADAVADARTIGWDMALTDRGPVVIEGNAGWSFTAHSVAAEDGLLGTPAGRLLFPEIPYPPEMPR